MDLMSRRRSGCPINLTLEHFGDRWSLIILRDTMFGGRPRSFRSLLTENIEGIASNILADRLKRLTANGLLTRRADPSHKQRIVYSLTEKAIDLVPMMAVMGSWGMRHTLPSTDLLIGAQVLETGGPQIWSQFMDELRHLHLGAPAPEQSVLTLMQSAWEAAEAQKARAPESHRFVPARADASL
jgi:DNA-binding HxlR family transcriptional regulator